MKVLSIVVAAMFLASCTGMGMQGQSGSMSGGGGGTGSAATGGPNFNDRGSTGPFDASSPYHGG